MSYPKKSKKGHSHKANTIIAKTCPGFPYGYCQSKQTVAPQRTSKLCKPCIDYRKERFKCPGIRHRLSQCGRNVYYGNGVCSTCAKLIIGPTLCQAADCTLQAFEECGPFCQMHYLQWITNVPSPVRLKAPVLQKVCPGFPIGKCQSPRTRAPKHDANICEDCMQYRHRHFKCPGIGLNAGKCSTPKYTSKNLCARCYHDLKHKKSTIPKECQALGCTKPKDEECGSLCQTHFQDWIEGDISFKPQYIENPCPGFPIGQCHAAEPAKRKPGAKICEACIQYRHLHFKCPGIGPKLGMCNRNKYCAKGLCIDCASMSIDLPPQCQEQDCERRPEHLCGPLCQIHYQHWIANIPALLKFKNAARAIASMRDKPALSKTSSLNSKVPIAAPSAAAAASAAAAVSADTDIVNRKRHFEDDIQIPPFDALIMPGSDLLQAVCRNPHCFNNTAIAGELCYRCINPAAAIAPKRAIATCLSFDCFNPVEKFGDYCSLCLAAINSLESMQEDHIQLCPMCNKIVGIDCDC